MKFVTPNIDLFNKHREKYPLFTYHKYEWILKGSILTLYFTYSFKGEDQIRTEIKLTLPSEIDEEIIRNHEDYIFRIGLINALSYWKAYCSPKINIICGNLNEFEINWWINLWYEGLGEFRYRNGLLSVLKDDWVNITCDYKNYSNNSSKHNFNNLNGNMIAFTGGKDSTLVLGILKESDNEIFVINPIKEAEIIKEILGFSNSPQITVFRTVDDSLINMNKEGALNGHTPFSAIISFIGVFVASIRNKKYFIVGNESSANESTVPGTNINHQYSKSIIFEKSFQDYCNIVWPGGPLYTSILRPITEIGIVRMLKKYDKVMPYISSCNVKNRNSLWCGNCPKCFFASLLFSAIWDIPFTEKIIGVNMFNNMSNMDTLCELTGIADTKPFECIGTTDESRAILAKIYSNGGFVDQPLLKEFFHLHKDMLPKPERFTEIANEFNDHLLPFELSDIISKEHKNII